MTVDGHCPSPKPINSGVPQGSVLSPTLFLLFIILLLSITNCPIQLYAEDSTLHYSTHFDRRPTLQDLLQAEGGRTVKLQILLSYVIGSEGTWYLLMRQKLNFFIYLIDKTF